MGLVMAVSGRLSLDQMKSRRETSRFKLGSSREKRKEDSREVKREVKRVEKSEEQGEDSGQRSEGKEGVQKVEK